MRRASSFALFAACLVGCAVGNYAPRLSDKEYEELALAAETYSKNRAPLPEPIRRLRPVDAHYYLANVVIVMQRDAHEERGYLIHTGLSSILPDPGAQQWKGWNLKEIKSPSIPSLDIIYEYSRSR
jgi:hypothetical protein